MTLNIFCTGNRIEIVPATVSAELNKLHKWFAVNKLSLNIKKTILLSVRRIVKVNFNQSINQSVVQVLNLRINRF